MISDSFLYKKEINKSVLLEGFGIDREYLTLFTRGIGSLTRGENRDIVFIFNNHEYHVTIQNLNNARDRRINDAYQIRYPANGEFAKSLQGTFFRSYNYINEMRKIEEQQNPGKRKFIKLPDENKEYLAIYC